MSHTLRVIDAGLREGRYNIALDQAMIEAHQEGRIPDTLRFIHFRPSALVGRHQELSTEIDVDFCRAHGIDVGRRITGGGAIYLDEGQLGWALALNRATLGSRGLGDIAAAICEAAAAGLGRLGVEARFRPRNDIEIDGRKVSGTGGFHDGDTLFYQGTVLVDLDPARMLGALRVPQAKTARHGLDSAARRVVCLRELLGDATPSIVQVQEALLEGFREHLGFDFRAEPVSAAEQQLADTLHAESIGQDEFVGEIDAPPGKGTVTSGVHTGRGGTITAYLRREGPASQRIGQVLLTGDFFVAPPRLVLDLEASLRGTDISDLRGNIDTFFASHPISAISITPEDFCSAIEAALETSAASA